MPGSELLGEEEKKEVLDVLETGVLFRYNHDEQRKGIWKAKSFEQELAHYTGARFAHMCSSGTTAVSAMMAAAGIGLHDEVIVPPFTYIATVEGVLLGGAIPVFAEIDETLCLSPEGIRKVITPKTKAIVLVHMCGAPARLDEILEICKEHNLILIEDAAQALGASYKGKMLGTFGKLGSYSLDFFKIITAGEGGAIVTDDEQMYRNVDSFSDHGHDHIGNNRGMEQHPVFGNNFRTSELHAAVALAQLRKIHYILQQQRAHHAYMLERLSAFKELSFRFVPDKEGDSCTFLSFFMPTQLQAHSLFKELSGNGVPGVQYWFINMYHYHLQWHHIKEMRSLYRIPAQTYSMPQDWKTMQFPVSDAIIGRTLSLVVKVTWSEQQLKAHMDAICNAIEKVLSLQHA
jgi:8-amino-3,8-dideoxy-alpha-D-manno-octulosonate transaminase